MKAKSGKITLSDTNTHTINLGFQPKQLYIYGLSAGPNQLSAFCMIDMINYSSTKRLQFFSPLYAKSYTRVEDVNFTDPTYDYLFPLITTNGFTIQYPNFASEYGAMTIYYMAM